MMMIPPLLSRPACSLLTLSCALAGPLLPLPAGENNRGGATKERVAGQPEGEFSGCPRCHRHSGAEREMPAQLTAAAAYLCHHRHPPPFTFLSSLYFSLSCCLSGHSLPNRFHSYPCHQPSWARYPTHPPPPLLLSLSFLNLKCSSWYCESKMTRIGSNMDEFSDTFQGGRGGGSFPMKSLCC